MEYSTVVWDWMVGNGEGIIRMNRKLKILINSTYEEQKALINTETNEVLLEGDSYHDKIDERIEGFLLGLIYCDYKYSLLDSEQINTDNKLFDVCGFSDEDYSSCEDDDEVLLSDCEVEEDEEILDDINGDEIADKFIKELKIEIIPHKIKHKFEIATIDREFEIFENILDAIDKTKNYEGDLFLIENDQYKIVYSCQGLELEDNNSCLKEFGVYQDEDGELHIIGRKSNE